MARSAKHVFNDLIRKAPEKYLSDVIVHLLNLLFSEGKVKEDLEKGHSSGTATNPTEESKSPTTTAT